MKLTARILVWLLTLCPAAALARSPYIVDDAGITDAGQIQIPGWFSRSDKGEDLGVAAMQFQTLKNLETTLQAARDIGNGNDVTQLTLQEKYLWHPAADGWTSSFAGGINYDTVAGKVSGGYAYAPFTFAVNKAVNLSLDAGWQYANGTDKNYATWGANVALKATDAIGLTGEVFGKNTGRPGEQAGISWQNAGQSFIADAVYGRDIDGNPGNWGTVGLTFVF